ncbi:RBM28 [Symbiodinium pilosum]|uniref:RBM28 protein n=1 Tax=Symbiodinium pilosum TaxID=2952 RepID=A0A812WRU7_SYMPI|nr:RBM28 [Symbiodinium pilosum]
MAFKASHLESKTSDHDSAMKVLEFLNDNPAVFGGNRRPIVEFAVEDKRKLRMQDELRQRFEEKLAKKGSASEPAGDAKEGAASAKVKAIARKRRRMPPEGGDTKTKKGRGARQREKRRALKAAAAERSEAKAKRKEVQQKIKAWPLTGKWV